MGVMSSPIREFWEFSDRYISGNVEPGAMETVIKNNEKYRYYAMTLFPRPVFSAKEIKAVGEDSWKAEGMRVANGCFLGLCTTIGLLPVTGLHAMLAAGENAYENRVLENLLTQKNQIPGAILNNLSEITDLKKIDIGDNSEAIAKLRASNRKLLANYEQVLKDLKQYEVVDRDLYLKLHESKVKLAELYLNSQEYLKNQVLEENSNWNYKQRALMINQMELIIKILNDQAELEKRDLTKTETETINNISREGLQSNLFDGMNLIKSVVKDLKIEEIFSDLKLLNSNKKSLISILKHKERDKDIENNEGFGLSNIKVILEKKTYLTGYFSFFEYKSDLALKFYEIWTDYINDVFNKDTKVILGLALQEIGLDLKKPENSKKIQKNNEDLEIVRLEANELKEELISLLLESQKIVTETDKSVSLGKQFVPILALIEKQAVLENRELKPEEIKLKDEMNKLLDHVCTQGEFGQMPLLDSAAANQARDRALVLLGMIEELKVKKDEIPNIIKSNKEKIDSNKQDELFQLIESVEDIDSNYIDYNINITILKSENEQLQIKYDNFNKLLTGFTEI